MKRISMPSLWLGLFTLILLAANAGALRELFDFALSNPTASHVVLVPFVTLALLFQSRETIFESCRPAKRGGLVVVLAGVTLLVAAHMQSGSFTRVDVLSLTIGGIVLSWIGGFLGVYGWAAARTALFPLLFLIFAVPLPSVVVDGATELLKKGSTEVVAGLFGLTNTPVHRDGYVFSLPSFAIEVADECSGIRSSIALLLTGLLAGQTFLQKGWTRALLVLAILPVTVLKNGIRIVTLSLLAIHVDPSFLVGQLHHEGGVVFFLLALAMLAPLLPLLRRVEAVRVVRAVKAEGSV